MVSQDFSRKNNSRILSIDRLRGFAVFVMVFFQFTESFDNFSILNRLALHSPKPNAIYLLPNFSLGDTNISVFLLAIGLTYGLSFKNRTEKFGKTQTILHFVKRYISIVGVGMTLDGINVLLDGKFSTYKIIVVVISVLILLSGLCSFITNRFKVGSFFKKTFEKMILIIGIIGIIGAAVNFVFLCCGITKNSFGCWLTLHHIGLAGLIALPFFATDRLNTTAKRIVAGLIMLTLYGFFHETDLPFDLLPSNMQLLDVVADGGFFAGFAWGAQLLIFSGFADLYFIKRKYYAIGTAIFAIPVTAILYGVFLTLPDNINTWAGTLSKILPINKGSVSPSYIMITTLICLVIFLIFDLFNNIEFKYDFFAWWGKNPLLMYVLEFAFIGGLEVLLEDHFETVAAPIGFAECVLVSSVLTFVAYKLSQNNKVVKL